jgi:hypothetical protein
MRLQRFASIGLITLVAVIVNSCIHHYPQPSPPSADLNAGYLDLQAGWRVRVVTPILKSGKYQIEPLQATGTNSTGTVELNVGDDFVGYETSFYEVLPANSGGVRVMFQSAEAVRNGKRFRVSDPVSKVFGFPESIDYIRLFLMVRGSRADHDMAIVAAKDRSALEQVTKTLQANPDSCRRLSVSICFWVPQGIAVRPEKKDGRHWIPVL